MAKITFADSDQSWDVAEGTSFLEFCQTNNAPHDFGCTVGSCGTCRMEVVEGAENLQPMDDEERETVEMCTDLPGARLGCQAKVNGDVKIRQITD